MGNHDAGRAMGRMAIMALKMRTNQTAIEILDQICEPYRGCDAEFEAPDPNNPGKVHPDYGSYTDINAPIGILIAEAFSTNVNWAELWRKAIESNDDDKIEEFFNKWYDEPYAQFRQRYEFC